MKKLLFLVLFVTLLMSCDLFSDKPASTVTNNDPVEVKLFINSNSKGLTYSQNDTDNTYHVYQYKAIPQFDSDAKGKQENWTSFTDGGSIGYFAQGKWKFDVQELYGKDESNCGVLRNATEQVAYINQVSKNVSIKIHDSVTTSGTAFVVYEVLVPVVGDFESSPTDFVLKVSVDGSDATTTNTDIVAADDDSWLKCTGTVECTPGFKTLGFDYCYQNNSMSSATVTVRAIENVEVEVSGSLKDGVFSDATLTVEYEDLVASITTSKTSLTTSESVTLTCKTSGTDNPSYQWYNGGSAISGKTAATYEFSESVPGIYTISCVVTGDNSALAFDSVDLTVE